jgi:DNA-3-methyladenine glycosylase II
MQNYKFESLSDRRVWIRGIEHIKKRDRRLARVIERLGPYGGFSTYSDRYGALVESIVYQQLAGKVADAILKRFKDLYKGRLPKPSEFLRSTEKRVRSSGISPQKYSYIRDLCSRLEKGILELEMLHTLSDEEVVRQLDEVRGIGNWTAEMFLIFSLARTDVLPKDDLGVQKAIKNVYELRKLPSEKKFDELKRRWTPYSSIATLYLWRSNDGGIWKPKKEGK